MLYTEALSKSRQRCEVDTMKGRNKMTETAAEGKTHSVIRNLEVLLGLERSPMNREICSSDVETAAINFG